MRQYFNPLNILSALKAAPYPAPAGSPRAANVSSTQQAGPTTMSSSQHDLPGIPSPFTMPFYYASLTNVGVYYLVPASRVEPYLKGTGLRAALFGDKAMVSFNFQLYAGQFASGIDTPPEQWGSSGAAITQELELNIVAWPEHRADQLVPIDYQAFIQDGDQTKLYGNHRVWVPCDAPIAIEAGEKLFGEPKFKTSFKVNLASQNPVRASSAAYQPEWVETWGFRVDDPQDASSAIFTCIVNTLGIKSIPGNISPITEYGVHDGKLIGCRWNILQAMDTYFLSGSQSEAVKLVLGTSSHPMRKDLETLVGGCAPVAVQTLNSAPAAIQSRAYYP